MTTFELCLIDDPDQPAAALVARRVSEDAAIVLSVTEPGRPQRFGDTVRLGPVAGPDAAPVTERVAVSVLEDRMPRFESAAVVHTGGYETWRLLAPHPGDKALMRLESQLRERNWAIAVHREPATARVIELWLAAPAATSPVELDALLGAITDHWVHPPAYLELACKAGGDVDQHRNREKVYAGFARRERSVVEW